jgi:hypothetical protein
VLHSPAAHTNRTHRTVTDGTATRECVRRRR